jgi:hypothetical protein
MTTQSNQLFDGSLTSNLSFSLAMLGASLPVLWEYSAIPVEKILIMVATIAISGSWITKAWK